MADHGGDVPENAQDLTIFVQNLLEQMVRVEYNLLGVDTVTNYKLLFLGSACIFCSVSKLLNKFAVEYDYRCDFNILLNYLRDGSFPLNSVT